MLIRPYWKSIARSLLAGIVVMGLSIPGPYITKVLIDDVFPRRDAGLMTVVLLAGAAISLALGLTQSLTAHYGQCVGVGMSFDLQSRLYRHIQSLDFGFFDRRDTGDIMSRFGDMQGSVSSIIGICSSLTMNLLQLAVFPPILFYINWKLALLSLAVLPFNTVLAAASGHWLRIISQRLAEQSALLTARSYESLRGIRTVQALGRETAFYDRLRELFGGVARLQVRSSALQNGSGFVGTVIQTGGTLAYGWYGWSQVLDGSLSLGTFMAFSGYVGYLYGPVEGLIALIPQIQTTRVHTGRFFEIYDHRPAVEDDPTRPNLTQVQGQVRFEGVWFSYDGQRWALRDIHLDILPRTTVALVGRSGSGKSTLAKLVPRFYDAAEGRVLIDGVDVRSVRLPSVRHQVGYALQGSALFQGSLLENLTFGQDIPLVDVEQACAAAYIHDFIASLPEGYHTTAGEGGAQLSEGQKQRIALARVLLQDAPILILDEPTSALDVESEYAIQEALKTVREGRTTIVIAHRLATVQGADEIVVMDEGTVVERGSHDLLLEAGSSYAEMHERARI